MITGLPYGTTPALGTFPSYPPVGVPTGPVGTPALGTWSTPPGGGGGAPTIPPFDPSTQIPGIEQITNAINQLNLDAQKNANAARIPGYTGLEQQSSDLIKSELGGQVPADVISLLEQQAAERGATTGMEPSSPNANAAYLRALGLTSLDLTKRGEADLTAAENRNPAAPIVDPSRFVMTPYQQAMLALEQERLRLGYQPRLGAYTGPGSGGGGAPYPYTPDSYSPRTAPPPPFVPPDFSPPPDSTGTNPTDPFTNSNDPWFNYWLYGNLGPSGGGSPYAPGGGMTYPGDTSGLPWTDPNSDPFNQFSPDYSGG